MSEGQPSPIFQSPEHNNTSIIDESNVETIHLDDESVQLQDEIQLVNPQEIDARKKRGCKGKKK